MNIKIDRLSKNVSTVLTEQQRDDFMKICQKVKQKPARVLRDFVIQFIEDNKEGIE